MNNIENELAQIKNELAQLDAALDARGALTPENINQTAISYMTGAFCIIRACARQDPQRASTIADAYHNLPRALHGGDYQTLRKEVVRAVYFSRASQ